MTQEETSLSMAGVLNKFGAVYNTEENKKAFLTMGVAPNEIGNHTTAKTFLILGITPEEFIKIHGSAQFDFDELISEFQQVCTDFTDQLEFNKPSKAVEFTSKMIYEVGPESRRVKKQDGDKTWIFKFCYKGEGNTVDVRTAFVCTFKSNQPTVPKTNRNMIILTVKQATLLSILVINKINALDITPQPMLLTPLAGAVFSKDDIIKIANSIRSSVPNTLAMINSSCQSGGQYLNESNNAVASIASIVSTRGLKDENIKISIINKTMKQYIAAKKPFDESIFNTFAIYANGGVPANLQAQKLIDLFNSIQNVENKKFTPKMAYKSSLETEMMSSVDVPTTSHVRIPSPKFDTKASATGHTMLRTFKIEELPKGSNDAEIKFFKNYKVGQQYSDDSYVHNDNHRYTKDGHHHIHCPCSLLSSDNDDDDEDEGASGST
uniref:Nucleocapsid protein n=1 Tax=Blattodean phasma-related virus OKIAV238 TaxID=2746317 RepID=A0A7D7F880_9VIRU|nr:nucleocapsid protein [Blattodean phasma-related virus OKIAV238]